MGATAEPGDRPTTSPYVGIAAVLLGGMLSTLHGRLLGSGLAGIRGGLQLSVDEGSWITTLYNMAIMFAAVFSVYLGALWGPRRVLLAASAMFGITCLLATVAPTYPALLGLQLVT